jgi:hypothetical protein
MTFNTSKILSEAATIAVVISTLRFGDGLMQKFNMSADEKEMHETVVEKLNQSGSKTISWEEAQAYHKTTEANRDLAQSGIMFSVAIGLGGAAA